MPDIELADAPAWIGEMLRAHIEGRIPAAKVSVPGEAVLGVDGMPPFPVDMDVWNGVGVTDRSEGLWMIGGELAQGQANEATIIANLRERDVTLGWFKYTNRSDAERRYREIARRQLANAMPRIHLNVNVNVTVEASRTLTFITAQELAEVEDEEIVWYAFGRLGAGLLTELDGKAKLAGKTTLVLDLVHAIVYGEDFLGEATTYARVVYLSEQSGPSFKRNLSRAGLLDRDDVHILLWSSTAGHKWVDVVAETRRYAREIGAGVLVVDTLAQFSGIRGDDENKSGAALQTMEPLQVATADGLAVLVSRHDRKSGGGVGDSGRGSSAYVGAVDIVLHLERLAGDQAGKEKQRLLDSVSRFEETHDKMLLEFIPGIDGERSTFAVLGDPVRLKTESQRIDVLGCLPSERSDAPEFDELRKEVGIREIELRRILRELEKEGLVERFGRPARFIQKVTGQADD